MNMEIVVVAVVAIVIVVIALSIYLVFIKRRDTGVSMIIQNGSHVKGKKNMNAVSGYFKGNLKPSDTVLINSRGHIASSWNIGLYKLESGELEKFSFQHRLYIGRSKENAADAMLVLADPLVSKQHCVIFESKGSLMIMDTGSKNHTFLNGRQIKEAAYLKSGDVIQVGNTRLETRF